MKDYFKGWYFKCCSDAKTISFIPAYHRSNGVETASLQIITDAEAFNIPFDSLKYCENPLTVILEDCLFSEKGISLNIQNSKLRLVGSLQFGKLSPILYDIMGPFKLVPFMQCRHSVYIMKHPICGLYFTGIIGIVMLNGNMFTQHTLERALGT